MVVLGLVTALAVALVSLTMINLATVVWGAGWDSTGWFVADNLAFAAMTCALASGLVWARRWAGRSVGPRLWWILGLTALAAWLFGLWGALVAPGGSPWAVLVGLTLTLTLINELAGPHLPLSGLWLAGFAGAVYSVVFRWIRPPQALDPAETWARRCGFSARESEVLRTLSGNADRAAAAEALFISPVTLKNHLASLYRRAVVSDLATLLELARSMGWPGPDHRS